MTLNEAKENINKKVLYTPDEKDKDSKEGIIISVGMHVFVKFEDCDYYRAIACENLLIKHEFG